MTITVWHYYNGIQQSNFDARVQEFNETVGAAQGIVVEALNQGDVNGLSERVLESANHAVGAAQMPDIFAAYADTAYEINKMGLVVDITQYMTEEEIESYIPSFMDEGKFDADGGIKLFPIAKSTEVFVLNVTDWDRFATETGASEDDFATWEGITKTAQLYYEWTDAQTPAPNDGKAFFGRDAYANYFIIGSLQLGFELFSVENGVVTYQINRDAMRRLWDNFYVPYVNGWFGSYGKFRSDDAKTGALISLVGSTSGASYFPSEVTREDGTTYPIESRIYPAPNFAGTEPYAVQQGAGMVVTKSDARHETASIEFLKWFTMPETNISYAIASGYLPVKIESNDVARINEAFAAVENEMPAITREILEIGSSMAQDYTLYTNKAFENGYSARKVVEYSMIDLVNKDMEAIQALVDSGVSRAEAAAQYTTDAHFDEWLADFSAALDNVG